MISVKVIIFGVEHGFCGAAIDSNGNILLVDCGRKTYFSPIRYLSQHFNRPINNLEIGLFVLSHPHGDHIQDVHNLLRSNVQNRLSTPIEYFSDQELRDGNTSEGYGCLQRFDAGYSHFTPDGYSPPAWVFGFDHYRIPVAEARRINPANVINNSSIVLILGFANKKIVFCGDVQRDGWNCLLNDQKFTETAMHPSVVVAPHHGHRTSYTSSLYEAIGKPYFNICSLANHDPHLAQEYSTDRTCRGAELYGRFRRMLSTRSDGTIIIDLYEDSWNVGFENLTDNERSTYSWH